MKDIPIIFSAPMVRALLDGRKTMTRRLAWRRMRPNIFGCVEFPSSWQKARPGDALWVKEAWRIHAWDEDGEFRVRYASDGQFKWHSGPGDDGEFLERLCSRLDAAGVEIADDKYVITQTADRILNRSSRYMPRWASRFTLTVTAMKIERLQDISEEDASAEGVDAVSLAEVPRQAAWSRRQDFSRLWDALHGEGAWNANPEVVALTFTVGKHNIDARAAA